jgi:hypothetical protein
MFAKVAGVVPDTPKPLGVPIGAGASGLAEPENVRTFVAIPADVLEELADELGVWRPTVACWEGSVWTPGVLCRVADVELATPKDLGVLVGANEFAVFAWRERGTPIEPEPTLAFDWKLGTA